MLGVFWNEYYWYLLYDELCNPKDKDNTTENELKKEAERKSLDYVNYRIASDGDKPSAIEFRQSDMSKRFLKDPEKYDTKEETVSEFMEKGKVMHALFSDIHTVDDVEKAVKKKVYEGIISKDKMEYYASTIREKIESVPSEWFDRKAKVVNERAILMKKKDSNGKINIENKRPDRIVMVNDKVIIIDYKFGEENKGYKDQVNEYVDLIKKMGYKNVEGYLWYVEQDKIENVKYYNSSKSR